MKIIEFMVNFLDWLFAAKCPNSKCKSTNLFYWVHGGGECLDCGALI